MLAFEASMNEPECSILCDFITDCHLPETIQVVDGYESLESEELSWSKGDIINLHSLKEISRVIARDAHGRFFSIPLTYHGKIFESIPMGCADKYETVKEFGFPFPKYVRSLRDIPQSGVIAGDIISLLDASPADSQSHKELKCRVVGKPHTIFLSGNQFGPFETLNDASPISIQDVLNRNRLPTHVRVLAGKTQAFNGANTNPPVRFEGLFTLEHAVKQKVFIVSTLVERHLRILTLPIDLQITVRREKSKIHQHVFSHICHLIETVVDIDSTITCGNTGDASWYFDDVDNDTKLCMYETPSSGDHIYEELRPLVPPRTPPAKALPDESHLKQNKTSNRWSITSIVMLTKQKARPKPKKAIVASDSVAQTSNVQAAPPRPAAKKPNHLITTKPPRSDSLIPKRNNLARYTTQNRESHIEPKDPEIAPRNSCRPTAKMTKDKQMVQRDEIIASPVTRVEEVVSSSKTIPGDEDDGDRRIYETIDKQEAIKQSHLSEHTSSDDSIRGQDRRQGYAVSQVQYPVASDWQEGTTVKEFRKCLKGISVSEVSEWLRKLGLSQYVSLFGEEMVDGATLLELDEEMMQCIGIKNALHRKKLLMFIQRGWTPKLH